MNKLAKIGDCEDCHQYTTGEYYMLHDYVWHQTGMKKYDQKELCIGCVERRLGRKLHSGDFMDIPLNHLMTGKSARLKNRLQRPAPAIRKAQIQDLDLSHGTPYWHAKTMTVDDRVQQIKKELQRNFQATVRCPKCSRGYAFSQDIYPPDTPRKGDIDYATYHFPCKNTGCRFDIHLIYVCKGCQKVIPWETIRRYCLQYDHRQAMYAPSFCSPECAASSEGLASEFVGAESTRWYRRARTGPRLFWNRCRRIRWI